MSGGIRDLVRRAIRPLKPYKAAVKSFPAKLDANESPWELPVDARERLARQLAEAPMHRYPDAGAHALRAALSTRVGGDADQLVLGVGSDEVLAMLMRAFSQPRTGREQATVLFPDPSFVMYGMRSVIEDCEPVAVPLTADFQLDMDAMTEAIERTQPNLIFLATPNNPTGNTFRDADLRRVAELACDSLVIIDEAYAAFAGRSLSDWPAQFDNVAVMGTLSKVGFAAARLGWVRMPGDSADELEKSRQPYNINTLSQLVATAALTDLWPTVQEQVERVREERQRLLPSLEAFDGMKVFPSEANFFLVHVGDRAETLANELLKHGVSVRAFRGDAGRLAGHLRITVGTPDENERLLKSLKQVW